MGMSTVSPGGASTGGKSMGGPNTSGPGGYGNDYNGNPNQGGMPTQFAAGGPGMNMNPGLGNMFSSIGPQAGTGMLPAEEARRYADWQNAGNQEPFNPFANQPTPGLPSTGMGGGKGMGNMLSGIGNQVINPLLNNFASQAQTPQDKAIINGLGQAANNFNQTITAPLQQPGVNPQPVFGPAPLNGLNQIQQDYFKYANAQRDIEQQNQQAQTDWWNNYYQAQKNQFGKILDSYQTGSPEEQWVKNYEATYARPTGQSYDSNYSDFNAYAQNKLGFNPNDPNNPNSVNGFANYDMGLTEVRRPNNSELAYINPTEGYQDRQGNYYDLRGNPMAPPSWASKTQPAPTPPGIGQMVGGPAGQPITNQPGGPVNNRFAPPNAPGVRTAPKPVPQPAPRPVPQPAPKPMVSTANKANPRAVTPNQYTRTRVKSR